MNISARFYELMVTFAAVNGKGVALSMYPYIFFSNILWRQTLLSSMRKVYSMLALLMITALSALAGPQTPLIKGATMYTGNSFVANWVGESSNKYLLSVYTLGDGVTKVAEDFSKVNQKDGKLDAANPGIPAGWTVDVAAKGTTDVVYDGSKNRILLDGDADHVTTPVMVGGNMTSCVFKANIVHAEGITKDNSSVFAVKVYDKEGDLLTSGRIEALYFASRTSTSPRRLATYLPMWVA